MQQIIRYYKNQTLVPHRIISRTPSTGLDKPIYTLIGLKESSYQLLCMVVKSGLLILFYKGTRGQEKYSNGIK